MLLPRCKCWLPQEGQYLWHVLTKTLLEEGEREMTDALSFAASLYFSLSVVTEGCCLKLRGTP